MSAAPPAKRSLGLPVCTLLLVLGLGALGWYGYGKWQEEQALRHSAAVRQDRPAAPVEAPPRAAAPPAARQPAPVPSPDDAYRSLPVYFIAGFGAVMVIILGTILYLWWSLKDLEGGKRYGEGETEGEHKEKR